MFMLAYCLLCLVNPLLATPVRPFKVPSLQSASLSDLADYPDLTNGLTDAEVQATLQDLTLEDLKSLDNLLNDHINQKEDGIKASLRTEGRHAKEKSSRSLDPAFGESCRGDDDDEPKPVHCTKRPTFSTTRSCVKKTTFPKTTRTMRPVTSCRSKSTYGPINDEFDESKCTKPKPKMKCKPKDEFECESDDFECLAKKQLDQDRNIFQEEAVAVAAEAPRKESAGIKKMREESNPALTVQSEPQDFLKGSRLKANLEPSEGHGNQASWKREALDKLHQDHHEGFEGEHQSHLEQAKGKRQDEASPTLEHQANLKREPHANVQPEKLANLHHDRWDNIDQDYWANEAQNHWANVKKDYWANADRDHSQAYFDQKEYENLKLRKQPRYQEHHAKFDPGNPYNFERDYKDYKGSSGQSPPAKLLYRNRNTYEPEEYRSNSEPRNRGRYEPSHQASRCPEYRPDDMHWEQQAHHEPDLRWEDQAHHQRNWGQEMEMERPVKLRQEHQAIMPQGQSSREQRAEVTYYQGSQQWRPHQPLTEAEEFKKMDREPVAEKPASDEPYERHELSRVAHRKRNAEIEKQNALIEENKPIIAKHDEPQPVNADSPNQETHLDGNSFIANSARDPPRYIIPMQNDFLQGQNDPVARRLNEDRSLSEGLNLDKLTGEKEPSPADWDSDNKRGKRENRESDDAPENSKETYIKKLMDSFPRDQGGQIDANVALRGWRFSHLRIKRSFV